MQKKSKSKRPCPAFYLLVVILLWNYFNDFNYLKITDEKQKALTFRFLFSQKSKINIPTCTN